jgi:dihydrofolate reductase
MRAERDASKSQDKNMRQLIVFNHVSLDGYFVDASNGMGWARNHDEEWNAFVAGNARGGGTLLFGRVTYQMMASFWPTPIADQHAPVVAKQMNSLPKIVFSRTLTKVDWNNTKLLKGDLVTEVRQLKEQPGDGMVILGSGSIASQLTQAGLIDEFQIALSPVILGKGRTLFETVPGPRKLKLIESRPFTNGNVFLRYTSAP